MFGYYVREQVGFIKCLNIFISILSAKDVTSSNQNISVEKSRREEKSCNILIVLRGAFLKCCSIQSADSCYLYFQPGPVPSSYPRRRSSNDSTIKAQFGTTKVNLQHSISPSLKDILENPFTWDFDIFKLERLSLQRQVIPINPCLHVHLRV